MIFGIWITESQIWIPVIRIFSIRILFTSLRGTFDVADFLASMDAVGFKIMHGFTWVTECFFVLLVFDFCLRLYNTRYIRIYPRVHFFFYRCDVSNEEEVKLMGEKIKREFGFVSILVNNAGIMPCHRFSTYTPSEIKHLFGVNVFAHIWVCIILCY